MKPIVGLLHHGSGPRHTSLIDPAFPELFAAYAAAAAERYGWAEDWTPINEPLTTGPVQRALRLLVPAHARRALLLHALFNQVDGTRLRCARSPRQSGRRGCPDRGPRPDLFHPRRSRMTRPTP
jgi:dTDP-4-dehydrorhamnose reductase